MPFEALPERVFLDSSTLQMLQDYGGAIWENEPLPSNAPVHRMPHGEATVETLRSIFFVNQRALWQFALSENSLQEVADRQDHRYLQWAYDVLDHWRICIEESGPPSPRGVEVAALLDGASFGYLSRGDKALLFDALALECDAFLTCDAKLAKNADHLERALPLLVLTPTRYWEMLSPWAALYT